MNPENSAMSYSPGYILLKFFAFFDDTKKRMETN